jgi:hypothetical protein
MLGERFTTELCPQPKDGLFLKTLMKTLTFCIPVFILIDFLEGKQRDVLESALRVAYAF